MGRRRRSGASFLFDIVAMLFQIMLSVVAVLFQAIMWIIWIILPGLIYFIWSAWGYSKSEYKQITHNSLLNVYFDKGKRGEYLLYRHLRDTFKDARWLFNVYLPREDGRTTEIDVMMIHTSGIYVFESKNYSGWIFGSQDRERWVQCIKPDEYARVKKYYFLNPLIQNHIHVKYLKAILPLELQQNIYPIVVFGNQCKLRNVQVDQNIQPVVIRKDIKYLLNEQIAFKTISENTVQNVYNLLYGYTQVDEQVKIKHIEDIEKIKF